MASDYNKDAYYFPHFSNARNDRKLKRVRKQLGIEGYGIFFMLLEVLREQADYSYPVDDIDLLADEFGTSSEKIRTIITNYELFFIDDKNLFFSSNLIMYLQPYLNGKERKKIAGLKGNLIRYNYVTKDQADKLNGQQIVEMAQQAGFISTDISNNSLTSLSDRIAIAEARKGKERKSDKGNQIKENKIPEISHSESGSEISDNHDLLNLFDFNSLLSFCISEWNQYPWLPKCNRLPQNFPAQKMSEIIKTLSSFDRNALGTSIRVYAEVANPKNDKWTVGIPYKDITGFLCTGVDKFADEETAKQNFRNPDYRIPVSEIEIDDDNDIFQ